MKKNIFLTLLLFIFSTVFLSAQNRQIIKGVVSDNKGAVPYASVIEKGIPTNGAAADENGKFTITLKGQSNVIIISATNYVSKEVKVTGTALVNITLVYDEKSLEDVIVVGYGKQKKITLTGAASQVSGPEIRQNPSASLQNGLTGKLPGFTSQQRSGQPGADGAAFVIRGINTTSGATSPLIIVDDIEYDYTQFSQIDANEVESITILKDASTTAVYGIKGANGVLVVTTRRGKIGKPSISLRSEYATMQPTILPKYVDAYNSAKMYDQALINDNNYSTAPIANFQPYFTDADLQLYQNGQDPYGHPNVDWKKILFKDYSHQTRNNLDITGGTDKVKYFVSLGYLSQGGILNDFNTDQGINSNFYNKRFTYRSNIDIKATKTLDLRVDIYGVNAEANTPRVTPPSGAKNDAFYEYSSFLSLAPFSYPVKNPNGTYGYSVWQRNVAGGGGYNFNNIVERLAMGGYTRNYTDNMNFITSANQKLDFITKGLSAKVLVSYAANYNYTKSLIRVNLPSYIYNSAANTYIPRDVNVYTADKLGLTYTPGNTVRSLNMQGYLNYDRSFGSHHFTGLALINRNTKWQPSYTGTTGTDSAYNFIPSNTQGITARFGYDYKQKYLVQVSGAYNGTDRFVGDKRYGLFPAVSLGWNIAEEGFFEKIRPIVSQLKLRGSYGLVGSDILPAGAAYASLQTYAYNTSGAAVFNTALNMPNGRIYQANFGYNSTTYNNLQEGPLGNNNVTWEKESKLDIGADFSFFNGKVFGSVDYFNDNRYDILTTRKDVTWIFGQTLPLVNLGKNNNKGYELELNYRDNINKDLSFSIKATYATAVNKIIYNGEPANIPANLRSTGQSIGQTLLYKWTGTYYKDAADVASSPKPVESVHAGNLKYADVNGDSLVNINDQGFYGKTNLPEINYGLQLVVNYKNLSLSALFQGAAGFSFNATAEAIRAFTANLQDVHTKAWTPELGNNALMPILSMTGNIDNPAQYNSTFWYRAGDYLRLRTAQIAYTLPKTWLNKIKIQNIQLYVNGNNLVTWSKLFKLYSLDPETTPGTDRTNYPPQKTVNIGLNVTF